MKKELKILAAVIAFVLIITGGYFMFFSKNVKIDSRIVFIKYSHGAGSLPGCDRYLVVDGRIRNVLKDTTMQYAEEYVAEPEELVPVRVDDELLNQLTDFCRENKVGKWNGFHKVNKNVLDAGGWSLWIIMEDGREIEASGYMKYPADYRKVIDGIFEIARKAYNEQN
ncbi:MAG: hypothetical protein IIZ74_04385 [Erysipelotrichaceae bacterium]|nr:hypothetical protein [Erysipelotrichaceae bacterium]